MGARAGESQWCGLRSGCVLSPGAAESGGGRCAGSSRRTGGSEEPAPFPPPPPRGAGLAGLLLPWVGPGSFSGRVYLHRGNCPKWPWWRSWRRGRGRAPQFAAARRPSPAPGRPRASGSPPAPRALSSRPQLCTASCNSPLAKSAP